MIRARVAFDPAAAEVVVEGAAAHHLLRVLRVAPGTEVELFDGEGRARPATVRRVEPGRVVLEAGAVRDGVRLPSVTIAMGLPKGDKLELVLQKGTELGATAFAPLTLARCVVQLAPAKVPERLQRWRTIAEQAARQCGRADVPEVHAPVALAALLDAAMGAVVCVLDEEEREARLSTVVAEAGEAPLVLIVGPEGGLTREEVAQAVGRGAKAVTLGPLVLRAETAPIAALAVVRVVQGVLG